MSLDADLKTALAYGEAEARSVFAGAERGPDDALLVGFTSDTQYHLAELARRLEAPSRIRSFPARWTLQELEDKREETDRDVATYSFERDGFCVSSSYLEIPENAIVWEVFTANPDATRRLLEARYGDVLKMSVLGRADTVTQPVPCYEYELVSPIKLGLRYSALTSSTLAAVQSRESEEQVCVTVLLDEYQGATPFEIRPARAEVTLVAPLGQRKVVDTVSKKELRRGGEAGSEPVTPRP